jgi:hypothetical protein
VDCQDAVGKATRALFSTRAKAVQSCANKIAMGKIPGGLGGLCLGGTVNGLSVPPFDPVTAKKIAKAETKFEAAVAAKCTPALLAQLDACASDFTALRVCTSAAIAEAVARLSSAAYGEVARIGDPGALKCHKAIGSAGVKYATSVASAMQGCLDKRNDGAITGDGQALCLGALTPSGPAAPADNTTAAKLTIAGIRLSSTLARSCTPAAAGALDSCGGDAVGLTSCVTCSHWRQAVEVTRTAYGPPE